MTQFKQVRRASVIALVSAAVVACTTTDGPVVPADEAAAKRAEKCGFDRAALDKAIAPRDDFYAYATGGWETDGTVASALEDVARQTLADAGAQSDRFVEAYTARDPRDARGAAAVLGEARELLGVRDRRVLAEAAAMAALRGGTTPFRVGAYPDPETPGTMTLIVAAGGAPLGDPERYDENEEAYRERIAATLSLLGLERSDRLAGRVVAFEKRLAQAAASDERQRYTERELASLSRLRGGDPWGPYFGALGIDANAAQLRDISALSKAASAWRNAGRDTLAAYLAFHRVSDVADFLPPEYGGQRDERIARGVAERIFEAEEGALLRGYVSDDARQLATMVGKGVLGPATEVIVAGGPLAYTVPVEAGQATATGVEKAAAARGQSRLALAGRQTDATSRLSSAMTATPRFDRATNTLDLPAGLLRGPVYGTTDTPSSYGALGGLILRANGLDPDDALRRAFAAYRQSGAANDKRRCGLDADQRFFVAYAQGAYGSDGETLNTALRGLDDFARAFEAD